MLVELGCGSAAKTAILLNALLRREGPSGVRFAGIDVSGSALAAAKVSLLASCPGLLPDSIGLVCAEYIEGALQRVNSMASPHARHSHGSKRPGASRAQCCFALSALKLRRAPLLKVMGQTDAGRWLRP